MTPKRILAAQKSDLARALYKRFPGLPRKAVDSSIESALGRVIEALAAGRRAEIRGFGVFYLSHRKPRLARNPQNGETVEVPAKAVPRFRAGKHLSERVDYPAP